MNGTVTQFNSLLEKYKLGEPVSPAQQAFIIKQRKTDLKKLLKKTGQYGIVIWLAILIFERLRDLGITLTIVQSKIILGVAAVAIASGYSIGTYTTAKYVIKAISKPEKKIEEKIEEKTEEIENGYIRLDDDTIPPTRPAETKKVVKKAAPIKKVEIQTQIKKNDEKKSDRGEKKKKGFEAEPVSDVPTL